MEWHALFTSEQPPTYSDMEQYIGGEGARLWKALFDYMEMAYRVKPKMTYSGCSGKPGWNVKFQKSGQSFGTLYPEQDGFSVFMVISYKHDLEMEIVKHSLSPNLRSLYEGAQDYMKLGRWMMFRISTEGDLQDYKRLMTVKLQPKLEAAV